jgi:hypothetical protein
MLGGGLAAWAVTGTWLGEHPGADAVAYRERLLYLLMIGGVASLMIFPITLPALRAMRRQIGTDGSQIFLRLGEGRVLAVEPGKLGHSGRALLYRQYSLPLRNAQGRSLFAEGELETYLDPVLANARKLDARQALLHQWRYRDPALLWPLAGVCGLGLLLALFVALQLNAPLP